MINNKQHFIKDEMFLLLANLSPNETAAWGKMNVQQMVEHLVVFFNVSTEKIIFPLVTPQEHLPKYKEFLYSDKQFRENTKAPAAVLGDEPLPTNYPTLEIANHKLKAAVAYFFTYFENSPEKQTLHPVFGMLNFDEWVLLHHKHVTHHLRQFNLM
jgi:oxepin-CoA hydrolase/3-oxo-5,6-dehydrosuberyl-CoA semialdehyde dehydrogenase